MLSRMSSQEEVTPPLDEFLSRYAEDDNEWWRLSCGHHQNLFEEAVERIEELQALLQAERSHATDRRERPF